MKKVVVLLAVLTGLAALASADVLETKFRQGSELNAAQVALSVRFEYAYRSDYVEQCSGYLVKRDLIAVPKSCVTSYWGGKVTYYRVAFRNGQNTIGGDITQIMRINGNTAFIKVKGAKDLTTLPVYHGPQTRDIDDAFETFLRSKGAADFHRNRGNRGVEEGDVFRYRGRVYGIAQTDIKHFDRDSLPYDKLFVVAVLS